MISPRIEVDLAAIEHNTHSLVTRLEKRGISVTGVTKATLGSPEVARAMVRGGVKRIGDSRLENLEDLKQAGLKVPLVLLRSPTPVQADGAVTFASASLVSDIDVVEALSAAAGRQALNHGIVLMLELGDLREGVMVAEVLDMARRISRTRHLTLLGIGTNLACRSGVVPGDSQMKELSAQATLLAGRLNLPLPYITGGNSANLAWALGRDDVGRVNDLRLGEAILLGVDPLTRSPIDGLRTDAFTLVGSVIESLSKPTGSWGATGGGAFGSSAGRRDRGTIIQTIVSLGRQDIDPDGITPPVGVTVLASSSDHLVLETPKLMPAGTEIRFGVNYSALLRAMTSPFVAERVVVGSAPGVPVAAGSAASAR